MNKKDAEDLLEYMFEAEPKGSLEYKPKKKNIIQKVTSVFQPKTFELVKESIKKNIPLQFYYNSKHSDFHKGEENPPHLRTVQPVVLGKKVTNSGVRTYFRAYLLGLYSYSKNASFTGDLDSNKTTEHWRVYDLSKVKDAKLIEKWAYRFKPRNHPEYNPNDKFFNQIILSMKKENINNTAILERQIIETTTRNTAEKIFNEMRYYEYFKVYATSENEEIGFIEGNRININSIWLEQCDSLNTIKKGLVKLLNQIGE